MVKAKLEVADFSKEVREVTFAPPIFYSIIRVFSLHLALEEMDQMDMC